MTGYILAHSACLTCGRVFSYNPHRVPSSAAVTGEREPICKPCIDKINATRIERGDAPFPIHPAAYEPLPETEL